MGASMNKVVCQRCGNTPLPGDATQGASSHAIVEESGGKLEIVEDSCIVVISIIDGRETRFKPMCR
jgi:hypothetical protein